MDTVRLCLRGELISEAERDKLWSRADKNPFCVGFLFADAARLRCKAPDHPHYRIFRPDWLPSVRRAIRLPMPLPSPCLHTDSAGCRRAAGALDKPVDQDVVIALLKLSRNVLTCRSGGAGCGYRDRPAAGPCLAADEPTQHHSCRR
ncbi:MAG: hypothetical protein R3E89_14375 [Thiolinea sp.]